MNKMIEWHGGECPVPSDTVVVVRFRCMSVPSRPREASEFTWSHTGGIGDVMGYRVFEGE